jgi:hypothetical protein
MIARPSSRGSVANSVHSGGHRAVGGGPTTPTTSVSNASGFQIPGPPVASMLVDDSPSYISARSANSIISDSRPTRIQADALLLLNKLLDELLLLVLVSAKSLATDRIKTDGLLKVMNNSMLAKDALLEAELELRNYNDSKRAEGGRVPLGLMATSRWDGTASFPVQSAYNAVSSDRSLNWSCS